MILQQIHNDAEAIIGQVYNGLPLPPPMYNYQPLAFVIEIDPKGSKPQLTVLTQGDRKKKERPRADCLPYRGRSGTEPKPVLLTDNAKYILGREDGKTAPSSKFDNNRARFRDMVADLRTKSGLAELDLVLAFLENFDPANPGFAIPETLKSNDVIGFRIVGQEKCLHERPEAQAYWSDFLRDKDTRRLTCLVTGVEADIETKLPLMIKGVPGGNTSGAALSSFNENAYTSYGLREFSAPISRDAGERFAKALNALLLSRDHRTVVGPFDSGVVYAYWSRAGIPVLPVLDDDSLTPEIIAELKRIAGQEAQALTNPSVAGKLLRAPEGGKPVHALSGDEQFHILGLSSHSGGRVAIRSALSLSLADLFAKQRVWFERLRIVDEYGREGRPLSVRHLAESAYRDRKDVPRHLYAALVEMALHDAPAPQSLLPAVIRRCQIGSEEGATGRTRREHVTHARASLIRLLLTWEQFEEKPDTMSDLAPENEQSPAYRCGRLLYHLERIQYLALGRVNATLVDRYYGGASTTPVAVFPHLLRMTNQAHLPQIRRKRGNYLFQQLQNELAEIMSGIGTDFKPYFELADQGRFSLGYYHQRAKVNRENAERSAALDAARTAGQPLPDALPDDELTDQDSEEDTES